jgi:two-component system LytT family response regulator
VSGVSPARFRALIVDDEPLAREGIAALLENDADVLVAGTASGVDAAALIARVKPDILFLDIQMPEVDGFAVLERVGADAVPAIVFVTAFDRYALRAFEVHALDYLLKPFSGGRFKQMMVHVREALQRRTSDTAAATQPYPDRLVVKSTGRIYFVRVDDIDWCQAAGNYIRLHVGRQEHLVRRTMAELQQLLDPSAFVRIHRSTIVNVNRVEELRPLFGGDYLVILRGGTELTLSRRFRHAAARLLSNDAVAPAAPRPAEIGR